MVEVVGGPFGMAFGFVFPGSGEIGRSAGVVEDMVMGFVVTAEVA
jgi:hypothetical protein